LLKLLPPIGLLD